MRGQFEFYAAGEHHLFTVDGEKRLIDHTVNGVVPASGDFLQRARGVLHDTPLDDSDLEKIRVARVKAMATPRMAQAPDLEVYTVLDIYVMRAVAQLQRRVGQRIPKNLELEVPLVLDVTSPASARITHQPPQRSTTSSNPEVDRFFDLTQPCSFAGCDALRVEWSLILEANGGEDCADCTRSNLISQFRPKVIEALSPAST